MKIKIDPDLFKGEEICTTLFCQCGAQWRAHDKLTRNEENDGFIHRVSEGCPTCGPDADLWKSSTDLEEWSIG